VGNNRIEAAYKKWAKSRVTVTGRQNLKGLQQSLMLSEITDGEALVYLIPQSGGGYMLQHVDVDAIDTDLNGTNGDNMILAGVEVDRYYRPLYYYLLSKDSHDPRVILFPDKQYRLRVPASRCIHVFKQEFVNQTRGISRLHTATQGLQKVKEFVDASLDAAKLGANLTGFLKTVDHGGHIPGDDTNIPLEQKIKSGTFKALPYGIEPEFFNSNYPNPAAGTFTKDRAEEVALSLGLSYSSLTGDYKSTTFANSKFNSLADREFYKQEQNYWIESFLEQLYERQAPMIVQRAGLPVSRVEKFSDVEFIGKRWPLLEPLKDVMAIKEELKLGLTHQRAVLRSRGVDPDEFYDELQQHMEDMRQRGIPTVFETEALNNKLLEAELEGTDEND
jgi:lambda family phage portal protein